MNCFRLENPVTTLPEGIRLQSYLQLYKTILRSMNRPTYRTRLRIEMFTYISHLDDMIETELFRLHELVSSIFLIPYERTFQNYKKEFRDALQVNYAQKHLHIPKHLRTVADIQDLFGLNG